MNTHTSTPKAGQSKGLIGAGILTAIAASLCCITPVLALIAGASGMASAFSWLEPARPYLIGVTVLVLGFAWYQKLKPEGKNCACDAGKTSFFQTKLFLGIVTAFAALLLAFPYYAPIFYPKTEKLMTVVEPSNIQTVEFKIEGMTCNGCESHVKNAAAQLAGVYKAEASYISGNAIIEFDKTKTSASEIEQAINETGYRVTGIKE